MTQISVNTVLSGFRVFINCSFATQSLVGWVHPQHASKSHYDLNLKYELSQRFNRDYMHLFIGKFCNSFQSEDWLRAVTLKTLFDPS